LFEELNPKTMGPPKSKNLAALQSKSRFCEGSMNDRSSAMPPVHFLGPEALAALEQPVESVRSLVQSTAPSSSSTNRLSGSKLLGQVWDGLFRGKLRLRKDAAAADDAEADDRKNANPTTATSSTTTAAAAAALNGYMTRSKAAQNGTSFASREEVMANYQQLVAEGFFKAKAIHSSRQPGPPPCEQAPNPPQEALARRQSTTSSGKVAAPGTTQWPLASQSASASGTGAAAEATTDTPAAPTRSASAIHSPASASSRGTKRAAANDDEDEIEADEQQQQQQQQYQDPTITEDKENQPPPKNKKETQPKKRLRTIASRDIIFMPKLRSAASRRNMAGINNRRSISASATTTSNTTANKLSKRQQPQPQPTTLSSSGNTTTRGMFDMPVNYQPRHGVSRPTLRNVSSGNGEGEEMRVLRSQRSLDGRMAPLSVTPDAYRGIPSVPAIPPKFTYGEDRENGAPWRGLRIR
jgi:hypothetical protein